MSYRSKLLFYHKVIILLAIIFVGLTSCRRRAFLTSTSTPATANKKASTTSDAFLLPELTRVPKVRNVRRAYLQFQHHPDHQESQRPNTKRGINNKPTSAAWPKGSFWNRPHCKQWGAVATNRSEPTTAIVNFASIDGWCLVVVVVVSTAADQQQQYRHHHGTPPTSWYNFTSQVQHDNNASTVVILSQERQVELGQTFEFVRQQLRLLSSRRRHHHHYQHVMACGKNLAYLYAIANGAQFVWDFDDDSPVHLSNEALQRYTDPATTTTTAEAVGDNHIKAETTIQVIRVIVRASSSAAAAAAEVATATTQCDPILNPYYLFHSFRESNTADHVSNNSVIHAGSDCHLQDKFCVEDVPHPKIGIFQSIVNDRRTVETRRAPAVGTLRGRHVEEDDNNDVDDDLPPVIAVSPHTALLPLVTNVPIMPALISRAAMWSLFLPQTTDVKASVTLRSLVTHVLARKLDILVALVGSTLVAQEKNETASLSSPSPPATGTTSQQLHHSLESYMSYSWNQHWNESNHSTEGLWELLFVDLYERGVVEWNDFRMAQLWISSLQSIGYEFPSIHHNVSETERRLAGDNGGSECREWKGREKAAKRRRFRRIDDVVLVGQFNYDTPATNVTHWVKRWREVFKHVDVRGPFSNDTIAALLLSGINAFQTKSDGGWFSPLTTLGDSLRLYANDTAIRGVLMTHDDLLFNVSRLIELGFLSDDAILYESEHDKGIYVEPHFTVYANKTFRLSGNNGTLFSTEKDVQELGRWPRWRMEMPRLVRASASSVGSNVLYIEADGGFTLYDQKQSDFLFVPTKLANEYADHADWMVRNEIFLEIGTPTIIGKLRKLTNVSLIPIPLCTVWGYLNRRKPLWMRSCFEQWEPIKYGMYHPIKIGTAGLDVWDIWFDLILFGQATDFNASKFSTE